MEECDTTVTTTDSYLIVSDGYNTFDSLCANILGEN